MDELIIAMADRVPVNTRCMPDEKNGSMKAGRQVSSTAAAHAVHTGWAEHTKVVVEFGSALKKAGVEVEDITGVHVLAGAGGVGTFDGKIIVDDEGCRILPRQGVEYEPWVYGGLLSRYGVDWPPAVTNGMISLACGMYPSPWPGTPPTLPSPNPPYVLSPMYGRGPRCRAPRPGFPPS